MKDTIIVGKIIGAHGVYGELKVFPITDEAERFYDLTYFLCDGIRYDITIVRIQNKQILVQTEQITDRTAAEALKGKMIEIKREDAVPLEEGQFFIEDLKGMTARDRNSDATAVLTDVLRAGGADVLVFDMLGKTKMMPFLSEYVDEINLPENFLVVDFTKFVD